MSSTASALAEHSPVRRHSFFANFPCSQKWESAMIVLQDELRDADVTTAPVLPLAPGEPRALIAILSAAKRNALVACFNGGGLNKKDGAWHGLPDGKPVSGVTVADLARDGMLTLTTDHRLGSARLTERGSWFARTLLRDAAAKV
jgi:hypothetical protein